MVGRVLKAKCRVKLDKYNLKPRPQQPPPPPCVEEKEEETEPPQVETDCLDGGMKEEIVTVAAEKLEEEQGVSAAKRKCRLKLDGFNFKPRPVIQDRAVKVEKVEEALVREETVEEGPVSEEIVEEAPVKQEIVDKTPVEVDCADGTVTQSNEGCISSRTIASAVKEEEEEEDISGTILELEQDEISTPKGPRKGNLPPAPEFPKNPHWVKPEDLLKEVWHKKRVLKHSDDNEELFVFPTDPEIVLSPHAWALPDLMELKVQLNATKSSLDHFPLDPWHSHTKKMNIANLIMSYVKRYFNPEFSSQAWGKMFEILCAYEVIPAKLIDQWDAYFAINQNETGEGNQQRLPFDSIHLCEAPGAFVSALNHFLKISYTDIDWNWLATTLNPYHEGNDVGQMINDDRLILRSLDNWTFLEDSTGNILNNMNLSYLINEKEKKLDEVRRKKTGKDESHVLLVTADGSIDCQLNPGEQEMMVAHLQYGEIMTALMILQEGGTFILKIFTFLEAVTISHLYLLSCLFKEVHLFKPSTSKEGNSEVYVICLEYLGKAAINSILDRKLRPCIENYGRLIKEGKLLIPLSAIPECFITRIRDAAQFFCGYQMKIIKRNASCFPCDTRMYQCMKVYRKEAAEQWIEWSEIKALPPKDRLFSANDFTFNKATHLDMKMEYGCFADKVIRYKGDDFQRLHGLREEILNYDSWRGAHNHVFYGSDFKVGPIAFEKPYKNIRCSRFCYGRVLSAREETRVILKKYLTDMQAQGLGNMDENVCIGHSIKRVYDSMAKSCDFALKDLEVLCFNKLSWDYATKSDFKHQKEDLTRLFAKVNEMGVDRSMFLCRFPLLTRLQSGFIFCLASVFEKIIIYGDPGKNVVGVMLHKFKGVIHPPQKNMFRCLTDILNCNNNEDFGYPVLQVVPMKTLLEFLPSDFMVRYNILLLCQDMIRIINVIQCMIQTNNRNLVPRRRAQ